MTEERVTERMLDALAVVANSADGVDPRSFARKFWGEDKHWMRGSGNAEARHGGKMLNRLERAGLVYFEYDHISTWLYIARITHKGMHALKDRDAQRG